MAIAQGQLNILARFSRKRVGIYNDLKTSVSLSMPIDSSAALDPVNRTDP
jgi:hypothetical protein